MANLVRRAGRRTLIVDTLIKRFRYEVLMKTGLSVDASNQQILNSLRVQQPEFEPSVRAIFEQADRFHEAGDQSQPSELMKWSKKIAEVRRKWRRGR